MALKLIKFCIINHHIKEENHLGQLSEEGGHILEGGILLVQCHAGCNLKRGVDHLSSGRARIWGRLGGCLHLLGALCLMGISLPRLLQ